jgi:hypothetical protein
VLARNKGMIIASICRC